MSKNIDRESLRTKTTFVDDKVIWTSDEAIGGLYTIDKSTFEMKCILNPLQVFKYGKFRVISIFQRGDCIVLTPSDLDKQWVIYNKKNGKVEYENVVKVDGETTGFFIIEKKGFLIPATANDPIAVVDVETMTICRMDKDWNTNLEKNNGDILRTVTGVAGDTDAFFYLYDTKYIVKINQDKTEILVLEIPEGICSVDYSDNKLWILPNEGTYIYVADKAGNILEKIPLIVENLFLKSCNFIRIVLTKQYVFLLPALEKKICIYDKQKRDLFFISMGQGKLRNKFPLQCHTVPYWEYCIDNNRLCFMPLENKYLEIKLDTFKWEQKDIFLPISIAGQEIGYWIAYNQWFIQGEISIENSSGLLAFYFVMIKKYNTLYKKKQEKYAKSIWENMKDNM